MALGLGVGLLVIAIPAIAAPSSNPGRHRMAAQVVPSTAPPSVQPMTTTAPGGTTTSTAPGPAVVPQPPAAPGLFDVPGHIRKAVDDWFQGLVGSAVNPALDLLGHTLLATPTLATASRARELWRVSLGLADGAYVLLVTIGGVVLLAHESLQVQYSVKQIAPRLVVGAVASNLSFVLAHQAIDLANAGSAALAGQQIDPGNVTATIRTLALSPLRRDRPDPPRCLRQFTLDRGWCVQWTTPTTEASGRRYPFYWWEETQPGTHEAIGGRTLPPSSPRARVLAGTGRHRRPN
jgi:hypothetical protein